ncbi:MAG: response regulator [Burkholderiaceae bacterium]
MPSRPVYRVAAAGLDPRDVRLIEIVFKHSQYNRFEFVLEQRLVPETVDLLIVNPVESEGLRAVARLRTLGRDVPVISAVPRGAPSSARHAISIDRLTLQLLPILNRVVEMEMRAPDTRPMAAAGPAAQPTAAQPTADRATAEQAAPYPGGAMAGGAMAGGAMAGGSMAGGSMTGGSMTGGSMTGGSMAGATGATPIGTNGGTASTRDGADQRAASGRPGADRSRADQPTRDFLREAGRLSREGDSARGTAAVPAERAQPDHAARPPVGAATQAGTRAGSNLVAFPLAGDSAPPQVRVLVVDDSPTVRKQLSLAFARMRVECDAVASAAEALQRLDEHHYDLALVDVVMPGVDGHKLTRQIRRKYPGTPVIILTSRSSPFDLARGALAGCGSYLVKPVPLRQLEAAIVKLLRRSLAIDDLRGLIRLSSDTPPRVAPPQRPPSPPVREGEVGRSSPRSAGQ